MRKPKPIAELAESTQKKLRAKGETDETRLAKWLAQLPKLEDLSPNYRKRLERKRITDEERAAGVSMAAARGHKNDEIITQFGQLGGWHHVNRANFTAMGKPEQAFIAEMYILGFMTPGPATQENRDARNAFMGWTDLNDHKWTYDRNDSTSDWKRFKDDYAQKFSK